jgi:hypothetical protein
MGTLSNGESMMLAFTIEHSPSHLTDGTLTARSVDCATTPKVGVGTFVVNQRRRYEVIVGGAASFTT